MHLHGHLYCFRLVQLSDCHLLMSAKLSTESELRSPSFKTKAPVSGYADQRLIGTSEKTVCNQFAVEGKIIFKIYRFIFFVIYITGLTSFNKMFDQVSSFLFFFQ